MRAGDEIHILHNSVLDACNAVVLEDMGCCVSFVTLFDSGENLKGVREMLERKNIHEGLRSACPECRDRQPMDLVPGMKLCVKNPKPDD